VSFDVNTSSIYAQQFGSLIIAALGFMSFSKREKPILILGFYGVNSVFFEVVNEITSFRSNIIGDLYTLAEALILLYFFYTLFNSLWSKKFIISIGILYCVLYFVFMAGDWQVTHSAIRMLRDLVLIVCSVLYFYFLMTSMPTTTITGYPMFWIVAAFIFFFAGTFVLSLSLDYLINVLNDDMFYLWTARNYFRFFFCLVVSYGLWLDLRLVKMKQPIQY
jgi:hypothetical protein